MDGANTKPPPKEGADGETGKEPLQELASKYDQHHRRGIFAPNPPPIETPVSSIHGLRPTIGIGDNHDEDFDFDFDFRGEMFSDCQ